MNSIVFILSYIVKYHLHTVGVDSDRGSIKFLIFGKEYSVPVVSLYLQLYLFLDVCIKVDW